MGKKICSELHSKKKNGGKSQGIEKGKMIFLFCIGFFIIGFAIFGKRQRTEQFNPYIRIHKKKWKSESDYKQYLEWLSNNGGDIPIPEMKQPQDIEAEKEIRKAYMR